MMPLQDANFIWKIYWKLLWKNDEAVILVNSLLERSPGSATFTLPILKELSKP
jgi:hypothetical protein